MTKPLDPYPWIIEDECSCGVDDSTYTFAPRSEFEQDRSKY